MGRYDLTERKRPLGLIFSILFLLLVIGVGIWLYRKPDTVATSVVKTQELPVPDESEPQTEGTPSPAVAGRTTEEVLQPVETDQGAEPQGEEPAALPPLAASDSWFREKVMALSPGLAPWLNAGDLIRKTLVVVNDFSQGQRLDQHMHAFTLSEPFLADQDERGLYITRRSYQRYDALAAAIDAINVAQAVAFYQSAKPLLQQVFTGFNYPADYDVDDLVKKAAAEILAAPVIETRIDLVRTSVNYRFADHKLEALNPVYKQMLRMGPQNTRIIQNKLRLLMEALADSES